MKKVLFLIYNLDGGGAERVLMKILEKIDKSKFKIDLFLIKKEGIYLKYFQERLSQDIKLITPYDNLSKNKLLSWLQYKIIHKKVKRCLKSPEKFNEFIKEEYDTQVAFLEGMTSIYLSKTKCKNKIAWVHIDLEKHRTMSLEREKEVYSNYNKVICVSKQSKEVFDKIYPDFSSKSMVIYNPIDKEEIAKKANSEIENFKKEGIITFIGIGRIELQKGFDILLKAHKLLKDEKVESNLIILGEGSEEENLKKYISENALENSVKFLGFKENPYPYLKQADVYILSSRYEGYPLCLMEALTLEKPIISTLCTGPQEILENGKYGLMCEVENIERLKECMKKMILDKTLRKEYENKSKERNKSIEMETIIQEIENIL